eukprot:scaffold23078_cov32-Tisochrysis_lutea.AAC.4
MVMHNASVAMVRRCAISFAQAEHTADPRFLRLFPSCSFSDFGRGPRHGWEASCAAPASIASLYMRYRERE